MRYIFF